MLWCIVVSEGSLSPLSDGPYRPSFLLLGVVGTNETMYWGPDLRSSSTKITVLALGLAWMWRAIRSVPLLYKCGAGDRGHYRDIKGHCEGRSRHNPVCLTSACWTWIYGFFSFLLQEFRAQWWRGDEEAATLWVQLLRVGLPLPVTHWVASKSVSASSSEEERWWWWHQAHRIIVRMARAT